MVRSRWTSHLQTRLCKQWLGLQFSWIRTGECYIHVMNVGTFMPLQSSSWNQFVCLYACTSSRTAEWIFMKYWLGQFMKYFQGVWFSILTRQVRWPLDAKTSCISAYVSNYIPVIHMQSSGHTFHADTSYKNEVSLYHFNSMFQNWKFYTPDWLALYPSCTVTMVYNSTCKLIVVLLLGFV